MELLSDAVARTDKQSAWSEVFALILLFVGTLLFFALISYTPKDVPSWIWFSHISPSNHPAQNFIGPVGAIVAGCCTLTLPARPPRSTQTLHTCFWQAHAIHSPCP